MVGTGRIHPLEPMSAKKIALGLNQIGGSAPFSHGYEVPQSCRETWYRLPRQRGLGNKHTQAFGAPCKAAGEDR